LSSTFFTALSGSLFGSSSTTAGLFGQQQTTEGFGQKPGVLFNTTSSATETGIKFGSTTGSTFGLAVCFLFTFNECERMHV